MFKTNKKQRTKNFRSLMVTLIIAFLGLNALVLLVTNSFLIFFNFQTEKNLIAYHQQLIAQNAANTSKEFITHKIESLKDGIRLTNLANAKKEEQKLYLEKLLGLEHSFRQIILLNTEKEEILRVTRLSKILSKQLFIQNDNMMFSQVRENKLYISSIYIDDVTYEPMVLIAVPITDVFDDFKGTLAAELNLKFMWDLVGSMKIGKNGFVYIIDKYGNLIAFKDISRVLKGENLRRIKEVSKFINSESSNILNIGSISKGIQGNYVVSTHIPFGTPDWAIVVELPVLEAYKTIIMSLMISILIILLSFLLIIIVSIYLSQIITRPVMDLRDAVKNIGKGNLDIEIETESKDEIGELALSFNQMVKDLKTTTVSRDSLKKEIKERKEVEEELRKAEEKYRRIFNEALDAILIADVKTGIIIDCNPATTRLVERKKSEIIGQHQSIIHPKEEVKEGEFTRGFKEHINEKRGESIEGQVITKSGKIKEVSITANIFEISGKKVIQGVFRDITEKKKAEKKIKSLAYYDQLTNLSNRTLFLDRLKLAISIAKRHKRIFALIFIDIDNFKIINDALGHFIGDKLIIEIANRFLKCIRAEDSLGLNYSKSNSKNLNTVSRIGGDEFTILLSEIKESKDASLVVQRIQKELIKSFIIDGNTINISVSVGIAVYPNDGNDIETLIKNADIAMYNAKSLGKNNFQYYNHSMNISAQKWLAIGNELRKAINNKEFSIYYQPIVDSKSNQIAALEALIRWIHPKKGLIPPNDFIPIAEEIGLIIDIGNQVLDIVGNHYKKWINLGLKKVKIAINISPKQLNHKNFIDIIKNTIKKYHIPPDILTLEITENCIINNIQAVNSIISKIRKLGIKISLDDFGAGYTSFLTLKQIPFDIIKIDRLFITKIPENTEDSIITSSIISIGHNFNLKVVAEGVENESQLSFLKFWNCDMIQGYYYYKPLPEEKIIELLSKK